MTAARRHILPFFIPHLGCPNQCIFCDQRTIAGAVRSPAPDDVWARLAELPAGAEQAPELAFYGGSFTALAGDVQQAYLRPAAQAMREGRISGIRISTRPDAIDADILALLQHYGVGTVELGVQSMTDEVLRLAKRGHSAADAENALRTLQAAGMTAGVQLMPGLPGETHRSAIDGARRILSLRPDMLRIYPTVVIEGTECAAMYLRGEYRPLTPDEAAAVTLDIRVIAESLGVRVIRMGLQPSDGLAAQVLAGPYHPAFGSLVNSLMWREKVLLMLQKHADVARIAVNKRDLPSVVGQGRQNMPYYYELFPRLRLKTRELPDGALLAITADGAELLLTDEQWRIRRLAGLAAAE